MSGKQFGVLVGLAVVVIGLQVAQLAASLKLGSQIGVVSAYYQEHWNDK